MYFIDFVDYVETWRIERDNNLPRCKLFCLIFENQENWSLVIKTLLIKNPTKYISVNYLQEKLRFIKRNYTKPYLFLDFKGVTIYKLLGGVI